MDIAKMYLLAKEVNKDNQTQSSLELLNLLKQAMEETNAKTSNSKNLLKFCNKLMKNTHYEKTKKPFRDGGYQYITDGYIAVKTTKELYKDDFEENFPKGVISVLNGLNGLVKLETKLNLNDLKQYCKLQKAQNNKAIFCLGKFEDEFISFNADFLKDCIEALNDNYELRYNKQFAILKDETTTILICKISCYDYKLTVPTYQMPCYPDVKIEKAE